MSTYSVGTGAYTKATVGDLRLALPPHGGLAVVLGVPGDARHDVGQALAAQGVLVAYRFDPEPGPQYDANLTIEENAARWVGNLLGGLRPDQWLQIYRWALGPNELYGNPPPGAPIPAIWDTYIALEVSICHMLKGLGIDYIFGSVASGNVDPAVLILKFRQLLEEAAGVCYHLYIAPGRTTIEPPDNVYYIRRAYAWWQACKAAQIRFPPLLGGESGTYEPYRSLGMSDVDAAHLATTISDLLYGWRQEGMPVIGHCLYAVGGVGTEAVWNYLNDGLTTVGTWNRRTDLIDLTGEVPVGPEERLRYFSDLWIRHGTVYVPGQAISDYWTNLVNSGVWIGPPNEPPHDTENGQFTYQAFASDVLTYEKATGRVTRGLPPLM